jgi:alpha-L-fucosidase
VDDINLKTTQIQFNMKTTINFNHRRLLIFTAMLLIFFVGMAQNKIDYLNEPSEQIDRRMKWFTDAKYGMFIHFGLYSQLGGEWEGKVAGKYAEWLQAEADIPAQVYSMLTTTFNPQDFNADFIARTAKEAGMKYIVITTKHHEGFCLWNSEYTNFDVGSTPFAGRDILAELSVACKKYGLKFCTYYSIIDWHHPSQERNIDGTNIRQRWAHIRMKSQKKAEYITYMKNQIRELIEKYNTDMMWFDGDWVYWWNIEDGKELYQYIRELKPEIIINNRVAKRRIFKKDFGTPEQEHPDANQAYPWEACYTLNGSWGYKENDTNWKDAQTVFDMLKDINTKGGNFLLNIGPDGNGKVPEKSIQIISEVGEKIKESKK